MNLINRLKPYKMNIKSMSINCVEKNPNGVKTVDCKRVYKIKNVVPKGITKYSMLGSWK